MEQIKSIPRFYLQVASVSGDGMHLEVSPGDLDGKYSREKPDPIAVFRAEKENNILVEINTSEGTIQFPLEELEKAIQIAREEVHSEAYYDK